jgi:phosphoenolpyruvate carboxykinase (GTP)
MTQNKKLNTWINKMAKLCNPKEIHLCDGSEDEYNRLLEMMVESKMAIELNHDIRPHSYLFLSDPSDVARIEERTFIASIHEKDAGPTNNWIDPHELKTTMTELFRNSMVGRTMYIMPFVMGPIGSDFSKIGVQITDSPYVVVHMKIMTRMGIKALEMLGSDGDFIECLHSVGYPLKEGISDVTWPCAPMKDKYIAHFPEEKKIWSYGSGYGGNALLGKKCLALRIASKMAHEEGWLAEHMLLLKITNPKQEVKYFAAAFPSACGKTNLAMLVPTLLGWKIETIGDDIAWMRFKADGKLYAINPEAGFFGVAKGTSPFKNPSAIQALKSHALFTNVALTDEHDVWWVDSDIETPEHLINWQGNHWFKGNPKEASHPNARYTIPITSSPVTAKEWDDPNGVPISAIIFGGRRKTTIPLVHESLNWNHGIFLGSIMGSEITNAMISDHVGDVRRDPFAMRPFIGYHVGDYLRHWLDIRKQTTADQLPRIFYVNWFKKDEEGNFLWPGFGENIRVLKWIFERIDHQAEADLTDIGFVPKKDALELDGLDLNEAQIKGLLDVDKDEWLYETNLIEAFYQSLGERIPKRLQDELKYLRKRLLNDKQHMCTLDEFLEDEGEAPYKKIF